MDWGGNHGYHQLKRQEESSLKWEIKLFFAIILSDLSVNEPEDDLLGNERSKNEGKREGGEMRG